MAIYTSCREKIFHSKQPTLTEVMISLKDLCIKTKDDMLSKYMIRLKQKLKVPIDGIKCK